MNNKPILIQIAGNKAVHITSGNKRTVCGLPLTHCQKKLIYDSRDTTVCHLCQTINKEPIFDWNPQQVITTAKEAETALHHLHVLYQVLSHELQISWEIFELETKKGPSLLSDWLNKSDHYVIEDINLQREELVFSFSVGSTHNLRTLSFHELSQYLSEVKDDVLWTLQRRCN